MRAKTKLVLVMPKAAYLRIKRKDNANSMSKKEFVYFYAKHANHKNPMEKQPMRNLPKAAQNHMDSFLRNISQEVRLLSTKSFHGIPCLLPVHKFKRTKAESIARLGIIDYLSCTSAHQHFAPGETD